MNDDSIDGHRRSITVPAQGSYSVSFPVRMTAIGDVEMQVLASSSLAADSLIRTVSVKVRIFLCCCLTSCCNMLIRTVSVKAR